jgi:hypothetical protein
MLLGAGPLVAPLERRGSSVQRSRVTVSGHVYDVLTGLVKTVIPADH